METSAGVPYYGIGVFMPIMMMGFAIRRHILNNFNGKSVGEPLLLDLPLCFPVLYLWDRSPANGLKVAGWC